MGGKSEVFSQCQGHTHCYQLNTLRCLVVSHGPFHCCCCLCLLERWQSFVWVFSAGVLSSELPNEDSRKPKSHTYRWKCLFSKPLKGRKESEKESVCVRERPVWSQTFRQSQPSLSKPHMDIHRQASVACISLWLLGLNTKFKTFSA